MHVGPCPSLYDSKHMQPSIPPLPPPALFVRLKNKEQKTVPPYECVHINYECISIPGLTDTKNASSSMKVDIKRYIVHPRFPNSIRNLDNDIALIELKDNITYNEYARPVCLPPAWGEFFVVVIL